MNGKIIQNEFKKWSQELKQIYTELLRSKSLQFQDEVAEKEFIKISAIAPFFVEEGVIQATLLGMVHLEHVRLDCNAPLSALSGLTFKEWEEKVYNRIKEHCIANGYYNPTSPPDLALLKERKNKAGKLLKDKEERKKILAYADNENYEVMSKTCSFFEEVANIMNDEEDLDDIPREFDFVVEDWVGRTEKLISKKEEAEKSKKNNPTSTSWPSLEYESNLETEIGRLQGRISELESKINDNTADSTQKETYQKILDDTKKNLEDKQKEKDKLGGNKKNSESSNKSNDKLNWAIGLGIGAIVIGLICLILLVSQRKER